MKGVWGWYLFGVIVSGAITVTPVCIADGELTDEKAVSVIDDAIAQNYAKELVARGSLDALGISLDSLRTDSNFPLIARYYYLNSGIFFEDSFPQYADELKDRYGFSVAELLDIEQHPKLSRLFDFRKGPYYLSRTQEGLTLSLMHHRLTSLEGLERVPGIDQLTAILLHDNRLTDLTPLKTCSKLDFVDISHNQVVNFSPLGRLKNLVHLNARDNQIVDLSSLAGLQDLKVLDVRDNLIENITPLQNCGALENVWLGNNMLHDIRPLQHLKKLRILDIDNNPIQFIPQWSDHPSFTVALQNAIVNYTDDRGNTLLHYAAQRNYQGGIDNLLRYGVSMNTINNDGVTSQDLLQQAQSKQQVEKESVMTKNGQQSTVSQAVEQPRKDQKKKVWSKKSKA